MKENLKAGEVVWLLAAEQFERPAVIRVRVLEDYAGYYTIETTLGKMPLESVYLSRAGAEHAVRAALEHKRSRAAEELRQLEARIALGIIEGDATGSEPA